MDFIGTRAHAIIDSLTGILLLAAPYLFGFANGGIVQWLPQVLGAMLLAMSLMTDYELSLTEMIPLWRHLMLHMISGVLLAASPWLFGFADLIW